MNSVSEVNGSKSLLNCIATEQKNFEWPKKMCEAIVFLLWRYGWWRSVPSWIRCSSHLTCNISWDPHMPKAIQRIVVYGSPLSLGFFCAFVSLGFISYRTNSVRYKYGIMPHLSLLTDKQLSFLSYRTHEPWSTLNSATMSLVHSAFISSRMEQTFKLLSTPRTLSLPSLKTLTKEEFRLRGVP